MNNNELCSVCCVGYNHAKYLEQNIRAIWEGVHTDIEIIVVDDGSQDSSVDILHSLAAISPFPMKVIAQENTGIVGKNFNNALKTASGKYITFISLDDILYNDAISRAIKLMKIDQSLAFIACSKITTIDEDGSASDIYVRMKLDSLDKPTVANLLELEFDCFHSFFVQGTIFRKEVVDAVGGFDEDMIGDDIVLRTKVLRYISQHPEWTFVIMHEPVCYYRMHANNIHRNILRQMQLVSEYLDRYWKDRQEPSSAFLKWALHAIRRLPFEKFITIFAFNMKSASLLHDKMIQSEIKKRIISTRPRWFHCLYKKEKLESGVRVIYLFSLFKFSYKKRKH